MEGPAVVLLGTQNLGRAEREAATLFLLDNRYRTYF